MKLNWRGCSSSWKNRHLKKHKNDGYKSYHFDYYLSSNIALVKRFYIRSEPKKGHISQTENILSFKGQGFCECDDFEKFQCLLVEFAVTSQLIYSVSAVATSNECFKYLPEKQTLNIDRLPLI